MRVIGLAVVLIASLILAPLVGAQPSGGPPRLGYLDLRGRDMERAEIRGLRDGLRQLGYVEGQTILIEYRFASGSRTGSRAASTTCSARRSTSC